ncbi:MAG: Na+/H+ antiporter NhaC [Acidobacteria bacterium]|nr:Na+/H+ antiporter NhaC [Acidobacteriota bacterium]
MTEHQPRDPTLIESLIPIFVLIFLLSSSVYLFGDGSSGGPNQIALIMSAGIAAVMGIRAGYSWRDLEAAIVHGISLSMGATLILLTVGAVVGTWIMGGIVPAMIYYGLQILHPSIFYVAACLVCCIVSLGTGSSWTTAGTVGIALIGIANAMQLSLPMTAGAIVSGAYFGDKMSPLSDTTNLAPAMVGTDLFTHIRHMMWTTTPSLVMACTLFLLVGLFSAPPAAGASLASFSEAMLGAFNISWYLLIPPVIVLLMVMKKVPALPALFIGSLIGGVFAITFQQEAVLRYVATPELPTGIALLKGFWRAMFEGYTSQTGNQALDDLLTRGGMASMLSTVWLILCAMIFGATMEKTRKLEKIANTILSAVRTPGSLVVATLATSIGTNVIASDQYIAIVLPGRMFRSEYERRGLHPKNLSRCLEDAGTLTSPLVPWNTCGAYMAATLGVATLAYLPFAFFNLLNPIVSAIYGMTGFTIEKVSDKLG